MNKRIKITDMHALQDKIYQKMSARRKLAILDMFYETGRMLDDLKNNDPKIKKFYRNRENRLLFYSKMN